MYTVEFYKNGEYIGKVTLNVPGGFVLDPPDSKTLRKVLAEPIWVLDREKKTTEDVYSYDDPVKFIKNLSLHYKSQGLRATSATSATKGGSIDAPFADRPPQRAPPRQSDSSEQSAQEQAPTSQHRSITLRRSVASENAPATAEDQPPPPPRNPPPPAPHTGGGPIDQRRYGDQPGPGWRQIGTSIRGTPIWDWGPSPVATAQQEEPPTPQVVTPDEPTAGPRRTVGTGSQPTIGGTDQPGTAVAATPGGPADAVPSGIGQGQDQPISAETPGVSPTPNEQPNIHDQLARAAPEDLERLDRTLYKFQKFSNFFRRRGRNWEADWLDELQQYIDDAGLDAALAAFPEEPTGGDPSVVAFKGTGDFSDDKDTANYIRSYLEQSGILFQPDDVPYAGVRTIRSAPYPEGETKEPPPREGDYVPAWTGFRDKLEEAKHLPGLESTEDLDVIAGVSQEVPDDGSSVITTKLTNDVISKLDEKFGKDKWIIKSYGDEAYAGFGVFLPPYIHKLSSTAKATIGAVQRKLVGAGHTLVRDRQTNQIMGIASGDQKKVYRFGSKEYNSLPDDVKKLGTIAQYHIPNENGTTIPTSAENNLKLKYGLTINWGDEVKEDGTREPLSVSHWDGRQIPINSPEYGELEESIGDALTRAIGSGGMQGQVRYFAQPAAEAFGVSQADRERGYTWETAQEGRVHITTKDGKVTRVPFATMARRGQGLPVVIPDKHILAMEQAAIQAIEAMPESERNGQVYAPDVMRTKDGWLVVERNASVPTGTSAWLEKNQLAIDAYVSHIMGREPLHARFIRKLLTSQQPKQSQGAIPPPSPKPS